MSVAHADAYIFVRNVDTATLGRVAADGTGATVMSTAVTGWTVGASESHVYWPTDMSGDGDIARADADGTNADQAFIPASAFNGRRVMTVREANGYLWFLTPGANAVARSNLDGTDMRLDFITYAGGRDDDVGLSVGSDYVYIADRYAQAIVRASVNGGAAVPFVTGQGDLMGLQVAGNYVYWASYDSGSNAGFIGRAKLDGTDVRSPFIPASTPWGMAVDGTHIYWVNYDDDAIGRANLDGTGVNAHWVSGPWVHPNSIGVNSGGPGGTAIPAPGSGPINMSSPSVSGAPSVGSTLTTSDGSWAPTPSSTEYEWQVSADGISGWTLAAGTGAATSSYTVADVDLGKYLRVRVRASSAGAWSDWVASASTAAVVGAGLFPFPAPGTGAPGAPAASGSASETACAEPPSGSVGVSIDDDAVYTNSPSVEVSLVWPRCAGTVTLSNDGSFRKAVTMPVTPVVRWKLSSSGRERLPKIVYVRFGESTTTYSDDIILDETAPVVDAAVARPARRGAVVLRAQAHDAISSVHRYELSVNGRKASVHGPYRRQFRMRGRATGARWIRVADEAGNWSGWVRIAGR